MAPRDGCGYGQVNRQMINEVNNNIKEIKDDVKGLSIQVTELFNHQSNRWPPQAVVALNILTAICSAVITGAILYFIKGGI